MMRSTFKDIPWVNQLGNLSWVEENEDKLKEIFPENWEHANNLNMPRIGFSLKAIGLEWRSGEELAKLLFLLERMEFIQRKDVVGHPFVRRNPERITMRVVTE